MRRRKGFTLVELLVVIIIVGVLAAVAIPLMTANVNRAKASEALAGLGAIRTQMRLELAEHGVYNTDVVVGNVVGNVPGFTAGDLDGRYFSDADYDITVIGAAAFTAQATGVAAGGTSGDNMAGIVLTIDEDGDITEAGY